MELDGSSGASDVTVASFAYGKDLGGSISSTLAVYGCHTDLL